VKPVHLTLEGFGVFPGRIEVDFDALAARGLFLVAGETGSGKTTIFDAMCWALYGEMPLKAPGEVRSDHVDDATRCEVSFTFEAGGFRYRVTRNPDQSKPGKRSASKLVKEPAGATLVRIGDDGATELVADKVKDVTLTCRSVIGLDAEQFKRVVLLPQGEFNAFLLADTRKREEILAELFGGRIYDRIVDELKVERDRLAADLGTYEAKIATALDGAARSLDAAAARLAVPAGTGDGHAKLPAGTVDTYLSTGGGTVGDDAGEAPADRKNELGDAPAGTGNQSENLPAGTDDETTRPDRDELRRTRHRLGDSLEAMRAAQNAAAAAHEAALEANQMVATAAERFDRAAELRDRLAELERDAPAVAAAQAAAVASASARPVVEAADALDRAESLLRDAVAARDARRAELTGLLTDLGASTEAFTPSALVGRLTALRADHAVAVTRLDAVTTAETSLASLRRAREALDEEADTARADRDSATARLGEIDGTLPELHDWEADPDAITQAIEAATTLAADRGRLTGLECDLGEASKRSAAAATGLEAVLASYSDTQAPRLAQTLEEGRPCPVCGSTAHPTPASTVDGAVVDWDQVRDAQATHDEAVDTLRAVQSKIDALRGRLGDAVDRSETELQAEVATLEHARAAARAAVERRRALEAEKSTLAEKVQRLEGDLARLEERRNRSDGDIASAATTLEAARKAAVGLDRSVLEEREQAIARLGQRLDGYDTLVDAVTRCATTVDGRRADLERLLAAGGHDGAASARALLLDAEDEAEAHRAAASHTEAVATAGGALGELEAQGIAEARPDTDAAQASLDDTAAQRAHLDEVVARLASDLDEADRSLDEFDGLVADVGDLRGRAGAATRAHQVCARQGALLPVSLKRWVLARELDRITTTANAHLATMTNGRYTLRRCRTQADARRATGLDLEVDDAHTGRARSTRSLSGGEQFQASLALALGLADVISHGGTATGRNVEALFVDEGFGSLSADALDDAVDTLHRLQSSGRMVGAITHVESMKQALHVGIAVIRREDGRGSTVTVNY